MNNYSVTETFKEVKGYVFSRVNPFCRRYKVDRDLAVSAAYLGFMMAYDSFDAADRTFTTWVVYLVDRRLSDLLRDQMRKRPVATGEFDGPAHRVWMRDLWLSDLSEDARTAALAVIDPPVDIAVILSAMGKPTAGNVRQAVREFLLEKGWSRPRIKAAFDEIRTALTQEV